MLHGAGHSGMELLPAAEAWAIAQAQACHIERRPQQRHVYVLVTKCAASHSPQESQAGPSVADPASCFSELMENAWGSRSCYCFSDLTKNEWGSWEVFGIAGLASEAFHRSFHIHWPHLWQYCARLLCLHVKSPRNISQQPPVFSSWQAAMYPSLIGPGRRTPLPPPQLLKQMTARLHSLRFLHSLSCPKMIVASEGQRRCHCSLRPQMPLWSLLAERLGLSPARFGPPGQCRPLTRHSAGGAAFFHH